MKKPDLNQFTPLAELIGTIQGEITPPLTEFYRLIPRGIQQLFLEELGKYYSLNKQITEQDQRITRKLKHILIEIPRALKTVSAPRSKMGRRDVCIALFLHDIGRFKQARFGSFDDAIFDHAQYGFDWIRGQAGANPALWKGLRVQAIAEAVKAHNQYKIPAPVDEILAYIQDVDKLALWTNLIDKQKMDLNPPSFERLSPGTFSAFVERKVVKREEVTNIADQIVADLSWIFAFHLERTLNVVADSGLLGRTLQYLRMICREREQTKDIVGIVERYYGEVLGRKIS